MLGIRTSRIRVVSGGGSAAARVGCQPRSPAVPASVIPRRNLRRLNGPAYRVCMRTSLPNDGQCDRLQRNTYRTAWQTKILLASCQADAYQTFIRHEPRWRPGALEGSSETIPSPGVQRPLAHVFNSRLISLRKRQSVPVAMIFCGLDLIIPPSRSRNEKNLIVSSGSSSRHLA